MKMQKKPSYLATLFRKGHIVTALLLAAIAVAFLITDFEYNFLGSLYNRPRFYIAVYFIAIVALLLLSVAVFAEAGHKGVSVADSFACAYVFTGIANGIAFYFYDKMSTENLVLAGFLFLFGIISLIKGTVSYNSETFDGEEEIKHNIAGYYTLLLKKYSFITVLLIGVFALIMGYAYLVAPALGVSYTLVWANEYFNIFFYAGLGVIGLYSLVSVFGKKIGFFDAYLLAFLIASPLAVISLLLMGAPLNSRWFIGSAIIFGASVIATVIRFLRFDPKANRDNDSALPVGKSYFASVSKKFTLLTPISTGVTIFLITLILFRYNHFSAVYMYYLDGTLEDKIFGTVPYLVVEIASHVFLITAGLIAFASIKSKTVCLGDVMLIICITYMICAILSFALMQMSKVGLIVIILILFYMSALLLVRITTVRNAAKQIK